MKAREIEREFKAGKRILERGSKARELCVVRSGTIRLIGEGETEGMLLGPGEIFGELNAILGMPSLQEALAEEKSSVLFLDLPRLTKLSAENPDFSLRLIRHLAFQLGGLPREAPVPVPQTHRMRPAGTIEAVSAAILERAKGKQVPIPVEGMLRDLASQAEVRIYDAYEVVRDLLDRSIVQLLEDRLSILESKQLKALAKL